MQGFGCGVCVWVLPAVLALRQDTRDHSKKASARAELRRRAAARAHTWGVRFGVQEFFVGFRSLFVGVGWFGCGTHGVRPRVAAKHARPLQKGGIAETRGRAGASGGGPRVAPRHTRLLRRAFCLLEARVRLATREIEIDTSIQKLPPFV